MSAVLNSTVVVKNLRELQNFWQELLPFTKERCLILLGGEVGSGKTTSVQMIAEILGMKNVQSPSFAIHLRYENPAGRKLDHLDLYRIEDDEDLESSGFWDLFSQHNTLMVVEWADRLNFEFLPMNWQKIKIDFVKASEHERILTVSVIP